MTGKNLETGNNSSRFQVLDAKNRVLDQRYHRGGLERAGVKISELDTPCPMGGCRSEDWKEPIILQNAPVEFLRVHWRTNCRDRLRYHHAWDLYRPLDRFLKTTLKRYCRNGYHHDDPSDFCFFHSQLLIGGGNGLPPREKMIPVCIPSTEKLQNP